MRKRILGPIKTHQLIEEDSPPLLPSKFEAPLRHTNDEIPVVQVVRTSAAIQAPRGRKKWILALGASTVRCKGDEETGKRWLNIQIC